MYGFSGFFRLCPSDSEQVTHERLLQESLLSSLPDTAFSKKCSVIQNGCQIVQRQVSLPSLDYSESMSSFTHEEHRFSIILNGELYNETELKSKLMASSSPYPLTSDSAVFLAGFLKFGVSFIKELSGCFSSVIFDEMGKELYLIRDSFGTKPLFYTVQNGYLFFSTKLKDLFCFPGVNPVLDRNGANEILFLGPARSPGNAIFRNISEVLPGNYLIAGKNMVKSYEYWTLSADYHNDSYEETVLKTHFLVTDAIKRQLKGSNSIGTLLSGGLDSAIVTKICSDEMEKSNRKLHTFSFDYEQNNEFFSSNIFQPSQDRPFVDLMVHRLSTVHHYLECSQERLVQTLTKSMRAHDLPCMADIDSSLNFFCGEVSKEVRVVLTGECADEVFGGYPWFHKEELLSSPTFPWSMDLTPRTSLLKDELIEYLSPDSYVNHVYEKTIFSVPSLTDDTPEMLKIRKAGYLSIRWFMQTLLNRMERCSVSNNLIARVPFADRRLVEYIYNVPWNMKCQNRTEKHLLRTAFQNELPPEIAFRKKSPYPKTYHPKYEELLLRQLNDILLDPHAPIRSFLNLSKLQQFMNSKKDYGKPWYGQLMAGPQMLAYLIQINEWIKEYQIQIQL